MELLKAEDVEKTEEEYKEIIKDIESIAKEKEFQILKGEYVQGEITKFFIKGKTLIQLIVMTEVDEEILEMITNPSLEA